MASINTDTLAYITNQANRLESVFKKQFQRKGIKGTELKNSVRVATTSSADGIVKVEIIFNTYGRFVDMGSSRGYSHGKLVSQSAYRIATEKRKARRPKKFYTRPLYGWIYSLQEAVQVANIQEINNFIRITFAS